MKQKVVKINQRTTGNSVIGKTAEYKIEIKFVDTRFERAYPKSKTKNLLLYKWLTTAFYKIAKNPRIGRYVPKNQIPKKYILKYNIDNMRVYNLPKGWRLFYSIVQEKIWIIALILEWGTHKQYERMMGH